MMSRRTFNALFGTLACNPVSASAATDMVLRTSDAHAPDYPTVQTLHYMDRWIRRETNHTLRLSIYASGQLGEDADAITQARSGLVSLARVNSAALADVIPIFRALQAPFLFQSDEHFERALSGDLLSEFMDALPAHDLVGLTVLDSGPKLVYNRVRPIRSVKDMAGLRVRAESMSVSANVFRSFGSLPVNLPYSQLSPAIAGGLLDGAEATWPLYVTSANYEVAGHVTETNHSRGPDLIIMSRQAWQALGSVEQSVIRAAAAAAREYSRRVGDRWRTLTRQQGADFGVDVATNVDYGSFRAAAADVTKDLSSQPIVGDILRRISKFE